MKSRELSYGLRPGVSAFENGDGTGLILSYPLKVLRINKTWAGVLGLFSRSEWVPMRRILGILKAGDPDRVETFLQDLVRRGFLRSRGVGKISEPVLVSVIVPVRNRPEDLRACLESLQGLEYPTDRLEVIVVDDASEDDTPLQASSFPVRLISMGERKGASSCRNLGASEARGDVLAFLDSDCTVEPSWLVELLPAFKNPRTAGVGGWVDSCFNDKALDRYEKVRSSLFMGPWPKASSREDRFFYVPSCNLLVKKEAFLRVEGFREDLAVGEDVDLCWRLQDAGCGMEYRPSGRVFHKHRNRLGAFFSRRFDYGTSEPLLQGLHGGRRKHMLFPWGVVIFWALAFSAFALESLVCAGAGGCVLLWGVRSGLLKGRGLRAPVKKRALLWAVLRSHAAFVYHLCSFISRYYLLASLFLLYWAPMGCAVIWGAHILVGGVEFINRRPRLDPFSFFWFFTLEQLAYQSGVWWTCFRTLNFNPVNPRLAPEMR